MEQQEREIRMIAEFTSPLNGPWATLGDERA